jgi:hypothetical protein
MERWDGDDGIEVARRYVEAFARLEAASAEKNLTNCKQICKYIDHMGEYTGEVEIISPFNSEVKLNYKIINPWSSQYIEGSSLIYIERSQTNSSYQKPYFICAHCGTRKGLLILVDRRWACRNCHGMGYRSQALGPKERAALRLKELQQILRPQAGMAPRPRYMRQDRFLELVSEYEALRNIYGSNPHGAIQARLIPVLTPIWVSR